MKKKKKVKKRKAQDLEQDHNTCEEPNRAGNCPCGSNHSVEGEIREDGKGD